MTLRNDIHLLRVHKCVEHWCVVLGVQMKTVSRCSSSMLHSYTYLTLSTCYWHFITTFDHLVMLYFIHLLCHWNRSVSRDSDAVIYNSRVSYLLVLMHYIRHVRCALFQCTLKRKQINDIAEPFLVLSNTPDASRNWLSLFISYPFIRMCEMEFNHAERTSLYGVRDRECSIITCTWCNHGFINVDEYACNDRCNPLSTELVYRLSCLWVGSHVKLATETASRPHADDPAPHAEQIDSLSTRLLPPETIGIVTLDSLTRNNLLSDTTRIKDSSFKHCFNWANSQLRCRCCRRGHRCAGGVPVAACDSSDTWWMAMWRRLVSLSFFAELLLCTVGLFYVYWAL